MEAGTGTDAQPYFRIFYPHSQVNQNDPELKFTRKWIPEYGSPDYITPLVDHDLSRKRAKDVYKNVRSS